VRGPKRRRPWSRPAREERRVGSGRNSTCALAGHLVIRRRGQDRVAQDPRAHPHLSRADLSFATPKPGRRAGQGPLEERLNVALDGERGVRGRVPLHHLALAVRQELGEVPLDLAAQRLALLLLQELVQRVGAGPVDLNLGKHGVLGAARLGKLLDLGVRAGLLAPELVAGEAQNLQTLAAVLIVQLRQLLVVLGG